jgi:hypothetical protein
MDDLVYYALRYRILQYFRSAIGWTCGLHFSHENKLVPVKFLYDPYKIPLCLCEVNYSIKTPD